MPADMREEGMLERVAGMLAVGPAQPGSAALTFALSWEKYAMDLMVVVSAIFY